MTHRPTTIPARRESVRWLARAALLCAALALVASSFVHPVPARAQFNRDFYSFCIKDLGQSIAYCCAHAGGVIKDGECTDPS
jgi:hypothetical protein